MRYLPPWLLPIAVSIISRYYYHTSPRARRNITRYQQRLQRTTPGLQLPKHAVYRQIRSFAEAIADRFAVWQHRLTYRDLTVHDPDNLYQRIDHPEAAPAAKSCFAATTATWKSAGRWSHQPPPFRPQHPWCTTTCRGLQPRPEKAGD